MPAPRDGFTMSHPIIITFLILAFVAFLSFAAEVLKPLAFAVLLSFALAPVSRLFQRWGAPRTPAAILTVLLALGLLGAIGYQVGQQLSMMANKLPTYEHDLFARLQRLRPKGEGALAKSEKVLRDVTHILTAPPSPERKDVVNVNVVSEPSVSQRLRDVFGPTLEFLGSGIFILILVLFMLINREDLTVRLFHLVGTRRVTLTTKTMDEVNQRITRYLVTFTLVNSTVGVIVGVGLFLIGVPYAVLWGVLAAILRFIPYVGPGTAFLLPFLFSFASAPEPGFRQPLMVLGLFAALEIAANSYFEPVIYGKTTGVSSFGLLVAAMFWTWLWGVVGLLLSTPMTVCLAVLGKYVPGLSVFATLLGEEPPLTPEVLFYQRLMGMDQDGAAQVVDEQLKIHPRAEVFDRVFIPALSQAERDAARGDLDEGELAFVWRVVSDILDDLDETPEIDLQALTAVGSAAATEARGATLLGVAANDRGDALALRMLALLLKPLGHSLTVLDDPETLSKLAEQMAEAKPALVVLSHLPPGGLTKTRYLVRRLHARAPDTPILVGRWSAGGVPGPIAEQLKGVGAAYTVLTLADARDQIARLFAPPAEPTPSPAAPALAGSG